MRKPVKLTPKGTKRYEKLLNAAASVFLESGFEKASMNEIINISGGSLSTVYKIFGNKEGLFRAVLEYKTREIFDDLSKNDIEKEGDLEGFLCTVGGRLLALTTTEDAVLFHRLIIAEGYRNDAKWGRMFVESAAGISAQMIAERLDAAKAKGLIDVENTLLASHQFIDALKGPFLFHRVLGVSIDTSKKAQEKALRQLVRIFVRGCAKAG